MAVSRTGKLNRRLTFKYKDGEKKGPNGQKIPNLVESKPVWFAYKQKYVDTVKDEVGTLFEDSTTIVIRQNQRLTPKNDFKVIIKEVEYDILKMNPDVENEAFLVLFIKRSD